MHKFRTKAATRVSRNATTVEDRRWLNGGEMISPGGSEGAALQDQMLLQPLSASDDVFLDSIFRDSGDGWTV
jgi:hypothetical protein